MKNVTLLLAGISAVLCISSCTIQKRTVNKGYFVQWHWNKQITSAPVLADREEADPQNGILLSPEEIPVVEQAHPTETETGGITDAPAWIRGTQTETAASKEEKPHGKTESFTYQKTELRQFHPQLKRNAPMPMDAELAINIGLLVLFLALAILFTILAINAGAGMMLYVWGILALVSFIVFVTQVIDVIMW